MGDALQALLTALSQGDRCLRSILVAIGWALVSSTGTAQVPSVLIEACSMLEPATKRIECLQQANQAARGKGSVPSPVPNYQSFATTAPNYLQAAPTPNSSYTAPNGKTCFVGPRGGTYTITKSGKKNYGGC